MVKTTKHYGAELGPLEHVEPMKFVAQNISQSMIVFPCSVTTRAVAFFIRCSLSVVTFGEAVSTQVAIAFFFFFSWHTLLERCRVHH